jgi:hypothetical protein
MRHKGRLIGLVVAVVVVVGAGIGSYFAFIRDPGPRPNQVVTDFVRSYTAIDRRPTQANLALFYSYLCATDRHSAQGVYGIMVATRQPGDPNVSWSASNLRVTGDHASFTLTSDDAGQREFTATGHVDRQNGKWLICRTLADQ